MNKTRTIKITECFCDICGEQITEHFGLQLGKCESCGKDICPKCIGVYTVTVSKFRGYCGNTRECLQKTICLPCGTIFESRLIKTLGLKEV